jgi:hypothetical protein
MLRLFAGASSPEEMVLLWERLRKKRRWRFSTVSTYIGTLHGALRSPFVPDDLKERAQHLSEIMASRRMANYQKSIAIQLLSEPTKFQKAATLKDVTHMLQKTESISAKVAIILAWSVAARIADLLKLQTAHISVTIPHQHERPATLMLKFVEGKGVRARRQPFTIASSLPRTEALIVKDFVEKRKALKYLWPLAERKTVIKHLHAALKPRGLELRSFMRGALQALGTNGLPADTIRVFSHHSSTEMLNRYLAWGWFNADQHVRTVKASAALWSTPCAQVSL